VGYARDVQAEPPPTPEEQDAPPERLQEEEATRGPGYEDPEAQRDSVSLGDQRPEPQGAPPPHEPERGAPTPSSEQDR